MNAKKAQPATEHIVLSKLGWPILRAIDEDIARGARSVSPHYIYATKPFDLAFGIHRPSYVQIVDEITDLVALGLLKRSGDENSECSITEKGVKFAAALREAQRKDADDGKNAMARRDAEIPL